LRYSWPIAGLLITSTLRILPAHARASSNWNYMEQTQIDWLPYGQQAFDAATIHKRPLFVFIYADWCGWCQQFEQRTLETGPIRRRLKDDYVPVAIDYEKEKELAKKLGARLVPTTLLLSPQGKKLVRFYGLLKPEELSETLDQTRDMWRRGVLPNEEFGNEETCCPLPD